ncbi:MAG: class I SAM-dependent methyltransferase, partial [Pseudomonadota bacterium]
YGHERPELVAVVSEHANRVLDLGCGEGAVANAIKRDRQAKEVWGIEVVEAVAAKARNNPAFDELMCGDLEQLVDGLPDNHFDHIVAGDVLEHLVDPWRVLEKLRHKLNPDGTFICSIPNIRNFSFIAKLLFKGRFEYKDSGVMDRTHLRFFARKDAELLFQGAGFTDVQIEPVRPKKNLSKKIMRGLFGDLVLKGFLIVGRH